MADERPEAVGGIRPLGQGASNAWHYMTDQVHKEGLFGGTAGPGKSFFLCLFMIWAALKYRGTRGVVFRHTYTDLMESTLQTFMEVLQKMGMRPGVDYVFRSKGNTIHWPGGSTTRFDYLSPDPSDPEYRRLSSREYTFAGVDEADQVEEQAIEALAGRLRYKLTYYCHECAAEHMAERSDPVDCDDDGRPTRWACYNCGTWTKGLLPKLLVTGNPGPWWTRKRYVCEDDGTPVVLKPHQFRVLVDLDDNPDKAHVAVYRQILEERDDYDRARLLHGDWMATRKTGREFFHAYDGRKHRVVEPYNPNLPLHFTMDFNTAPYITGLVAQIWWEAERKRWRCHFLREYCLEHPESNTQALCRAFARDLRDGAFQHHASGLFVYGDGSGKAKSTMGVDGFLHNYDIVWEELRPWLHNESDRVVRRNPSHAVVRDFGNGYLRGDLPLWVTFDPTMVRTSADMSQTKEAADGGILKVHEKDRTTGVRYEKHGHCLQAHYYLTVGAFPDLFERFVRRR